MKHQLLLLLLACFVAASLMSSLYLIRSTNLQIVQIYDLARIYGTVTPYFHLAETVPAELEPVEDWFQATRLAGLERKKVNARSLYLVEAEESSMQCLRQCYNTCNKTLPSYLTKALETDYSGNAGIGKSQKYFHVACAKLVVTSPKLAFATDDGKMQASLYGTPFFPKNEWTMSLKRYAKKYGCTADIFDSYDLSVKNQCEKVVAQRKSGKPFFWKGKSKRKADEEPYLTKDPHSFGGQSIQIQTVKEKFPNPNVKCPMKSVFAQEYANPLWLLNDKKFDNRVYLFVLSFNPLIVYMRPGHIHSSLFEFNLSSTFKPVHVTNGHIQEPYCKGCSNEDWKRFIKPYSSLLLNLKKTYGSVQSSTLFSEMVKGQIRSVVQLIHASKQIWSLRKDKYGRNKHGMLGLDMLVTKDLRWYILDVNRYPGWRPGPRHIVRDNYKANLEAYTLLGDFLFAKKRGEKSQTLHHGGSTKYWLQIYNEEQIPPSRFLHLGECATMGS